MDRIKKLESRIKKIEDRNRNVEASKAWETSLLRKILISLLTYLVIGSYLTLVIKISDPWIHALIPTIGFLLSTLTIEELKNLWIRYWYKR